MTDQTIKAQIFAVTSPGGTRKELYDVSLDLSTPEQTSLFTRVGSVGGNIQHHLLVLPSPAGDVTITFPPDVEGLCVKVDLALSGRIPADFQPEAEVGRVIFPLYNERVTFNALPQLIKMSLPELKRMFEGGVDFDFLADGLPERVDHGGPFEVDIDEDAVLRMVCLLSGMDGALGEDDFVHDVTQSMWDDFCLAASGILAAREKAMPQALDPRLSIDGHTFTFKGRPFDVCSVETQWAQPFEDDAVRLALTLMESQLLALYSAGVLCVDGRFNDKVVHAVQTSFDAIPRLIEDLDGPSGEHEGATHDRPA